MGCRKITIAEKEADHDLHVLEREDLVAAIKKGRGKPPPFSLRHVASGCDDAEGGYVIGYVAVVCFGLNRQGVLGPGRCGYHSIGGIKAF
jgi:hypothetical protein